MRMISRMRNTGGHQPDPYATDPRSPHPAATVQALAGRRPRPALRIDRRAEHRTLVAG
jgi:hypothetical protein